MAGINCLRCSAWFRSDDWAGYEGHMKYAHHYVVPPAASPSVAPSEQGIEKLLDDAVLEAVKGVVGYVALYEKRRLEELTGAELLRIIEGAQKLFAPGLAARKSILDSFSALQKERARIVEIFGANESEGLIETIEHQLEIYEEIGQSRDEFQKAEDELLGRLERIQRLAERTLAGDHDKKTLVPTLRGILAITTEVSG